jgi:hypothetical protein
MLSTFAIIIVIGVAVAVASPKASTPNAGGTLASTPQVTPSPTPSPTPSLSAGDAKFVAAVRAALSSQGFSNTATDAQIAGIGDQICGLRKNGGSEADLIAETRTTNPESKFKFSMAATQLVREAEKDICPQYIPKPPVVLLIMSGSNIQNSAPFTVNNGTLTVKYSYDCSSQGTGNFIADLISGTPSSLNYDDQSIANALGAGGTTTTTIYPQNVGSQYHLSVTSECNWSVQISEPGS